MTQITSLEQLHEIYGEPSKASLVKEVNRITTEYRQLIEAAPFVALATVGPEGLDCSPRGDASMAVHIHDDHTLMIPDRRGNNRVDSLRNIVRDDHVALLFLIPGSHITLRANGRAILSIEPELLASFEINGKAPRCVIVFTVETMYFQCARALMRADIWNPDIRVDPAKLPTTGEILAATSNNEIGGNDYDKEWRDRAQATLW